MIEMPPDDEEHKPCRHMAAVIIERDTCGEHTARLHLQQAVQHIMSKIAICAKHPSSCACHQLSGWTYDNNELVSTVLKEYVKIIPIRTSTPYNDHAMKCACGECYRARLTNGTADAYMKSLQEETNKVLASISPMFTAAEKADNAISKAAAMPGGTTDDGFIKNLFQTVQGVKFDSKCPHDLPYYACMECSH
jgi:hypothetical protein